MAMTSAAPERYAQVQGLSFGGSTEDGPIRRWEWNPGRRPAVGL